MPNFSLSIEIISMLTDVLISHDVIIFKGDNSFIRPFIKRKMPKTKKKKQKLMSIQNKQATQIIEQRNRNKQNIPIKSVNRNETIWNKIEIKLFLLFFIIVWCLSWYINCLDLCDFLGVQWHYK